MKVINKRNTCTAREVQGNGVRKWLIAKICHDHTYFNTKYSLVSEIVSTALCNKV